MRYFAIFVLALSITHLPLSAATAQGGLFDSLKGKLGTVVPGSSNSNSGTAALANDDIVAGLKEALRVGTETVVKQLGSADGYNSDPAIHIPLPPQLQSVQSTLSRFGLSGLADDLELKLNRAAEKAAPQTKQIIVDAVAAMTVDDAKLILTGPDDAATQYFKRTSSNSLKSVIKPIIDGSLDQVGAVASYDKLMSSYGNLPFVPDVKANLSQHTVDLALNGLFTYIAKEEAAIRQNPAKRTTELLTKVFGK